ncbi:MAG: hypothetical protein SGARI_005437, partial [Bacillariaceae sp.]
TDAVDEQLAFKESELEEERELRRQVEQAMEDLEAQSRDKLREQQKLRRQAEQTLEDLKAKYCKALTAAGGRRRSKRIKTKGAGP